MGHKTQWERRLRFSAQKFIFRTWVHKVYIDIARRNVLSLAQMHIPTLRRNMLLTFRCWHAVVKSKMQVLLKITPHQTENATTGLPTVSRASFDLWFRDSIFYPFQELSITVIVVYSKVKTRTLVPLSKALFLIFCEGQPFITLWPTYCVFTHKYVMCYICLCSVEIWDIVSWGLRYMRCKRCSL